MIKKDFSYEVMSKLNLDKKIKGEITSITIRHGGRQPDTILIGSIILDGKERYFIIMADKPYNKNNEDYIYKAIRKELIRLIKDLK